MVSTSGRRTWVFGVVESNPAKWPLLRPLQHEGGSWGYRYTAGEQRSREPCLICRAAAAAAAAVAAAAAAAATATAAAVTYTVLRQGESHTYSIQAGHGAQICAYRTRGAHRTQE